MADVFPPRASGPDQARINLKTRIRPNEITVDDPDGNTFGFIQVWDAQ
jgi:hypothetical protein